MDVTTILLIAAAVLAVVCLGVAVWLVRRLSRTREWTPWFGPLFRYELVRLARRGQQPMLRVGYVVILFIGLLVAYAREFGQDTDFVDLFSRTTNAPIDRMARFAETFLIVFLCLQAAAVLLMTPAIVGGAIAEDKERGAFDHLKTSLLSNREIVFGKLAARLVFVLSVLVTGLPVLALTLLFGGVDGRLLLIGFAVCGLGAASLGAFSIMLAVKRDGLKEVLVNAYLLVILLTVFGMCCGCIPGVAAASPMSTVAWMFLGLFDGNEVLLWINVGAFTVIHGVVFLVCSIIAVVGVRPRGTEAWSRTARRRRRRRPPAIPLNSPTGELGLAVAMPVAQPTRPAPVLPRYDSPRGRRHPRTTRRFFSVPQLNRDMDPLFWKERHFAGRLAIGEGQLMQGCGIVVLCAVLCCVGLVLFSMYIGALVREEWDPTVLNGLVRVLVVGVTIGVGVMAGVKSAGMVARERQQRTLESLLTIPRPRSELLRAKLFASAYGARLGPMAIILMLIGGVVTTAVHPVGALAAVVMVVGYLAFSVALGLWLSVRCLTVPRAMTAFLLTTAGTWIGLPLLGGLIAFGHGFAADVGIMFSPTAGLWQTMPTWEEMSHSKGDGWYWAVLGVVGGVAYGLTALGLWWATSRRFENEGR